MKKIIASVLVLAAIAALNNAAETTAAEKAATCAANPGLEFYCADIIIKANKGK